MLRPLLCCLAISIGCGTSEVFASVTCPSDINNDNQVNVSDLLAVVNAWGSCPSLPGACPADVSPLIHNGIVNADDLLTVVNGWGQCSALCLPVNGCMQGNPLWCENFETLNYSHWTDSYEAPSSCEATGFTTEKFRSATHSHKSRVQCATSDSHRGYAGLRFQGDTLLPNFSTPSSGGIDAPNGVVVTMWEWVDCPYTFDSTRWLSLMTCTHDCSNSWIGVVTLNIDDSSMRLKPVHVNTVTYAPNAPAFQRGQWNRITVYLNYYSGVMHVWQNGAKVCNATFTVSVPKMCQWHFGLYASGQNDNITMYEDDYSIVKLSQPMTNFSIEPRFPNVISPCGILPP